MTVKNSPKIEGIETLSEKIAGMTLVKNSPKIEGIETFVLGSDSLP